MRRPAVVRRYDDEEARLIEDGEESGAFVPDWQVESLPKI